MAQPVTPRTVVLNTSLKSPWGLAFLPDGRMLVTQKAGSILLLDAQGESRPDAIGHRLQRI